MSAQRDTASRRDVLAALAGAAAGAPLLLSAGEVRAQAQKPVRMLNVSYDPTRELYKDINAAYADYWKGRTGQQVIVEQSHGGSGAQARAVIDGLAADVVTLALAYDIDSIAQRAHLLPPNWQSRLPDNPLHLDHRVPGAQGQSLGHPRLDRHAYVTDFYERVPVLDSGARGATITFTQRGIGDVLVCWENEAHLALAEFGADKFEIVTPPISILAEPPVALLDKVVDRKGTRTVAQGYLNFLYSPLAQDLIGKNYYRPRNPRALAKYAARFPSIPMVTINDTFGGWTRAQATHFADGGVFDQIHRG